MLRTQQLVVLTRELSQSTAAYVATGQRSHLCISTLLALTKHLVGHFQQYGCQLLLQLPRDCCLALCCCCGCARFGSSRVVFVIAAVPVS
jgi:hypothetical protein